MNIDILFILIRQRFYKGTVWTRELPSYPSNNFAENPRKFPWIFPGNPRKFQGIFHRKIRWKCRQLFLGISHNPFGGTRSEEFLVTHSKEILVTHSEEFLVTHSEEILVTLSKEFLVLRISQEFPENVSGEILRNFVGKNSRKISQEFLETESQNCDPTKISNLGDKF